MCFLVDYGSPCLIRHVSSLYLDYNYLPRRSCTWADFPLNRNADTSLFSLPFVVIYRTHEIAFLATDMQKLDLLEKLDQKSKVKPPSLQNKCFLWGVLAKNLTRLLQYLSFYYVAFHWMLRAVMKRKKMVTTRMKNKRRRLKRKKKNLVMTGITIKYVGKPSASLTWQPYLRNLNLNALCSSRLTYACIACQMFVYLDQHH